MPWTVQRAGAVGKGGLRFCSSGMSRPISGRLRALSARAPGLLRCSTGRSTSARPASNTQGRRGREVQRAPDQQARRIDPSSHHRPSSSAAVERCRASGPPRWPWSIVQRDEQVSARMPGGPGDRHGRTSPGTPPATSHRGRCGGGRRGSAPISLRRAGAPTACRQVPTADVRRALRHHAQFVVPAARQRHTLAQPMRSAPRGLRMAA